MKRKPSSIIRASRCQHRTASGRQCCSLVSAAPSGLCQRHAIRQKQNRIADHSAALTRESTGFQTAQGINYSLGDLYVLLAQGRISPRRAAVLAQISSLLLRSLNAIDTDQRPKAWRDIGAAPIPSWALQKAAAPAESEPEGDDLDATEEEQETETDGGPRVDDHCGPGLQGQSESKANANRQDDDSQSTSTANADVPGEDTPHPEPFVRRVPPGTEPLPPTIDGFIDAIKRLKSTK